MLSSLPNLLTLSRILAVPLLLLLMWEAGWLGYTIAFFLFWAATAGSSLFTWILLRPASRFNAPARRG